MTLTIILAVVTFVLLILSIVFLPKIKVGKLNISTYWLVALFGAILMLSTLRVSFKEVGDALFSNDNSMNPIKILALFFSMTFISIFLEEAGFLNILPVWQLEKLNNLNSNIGAFLTPIGALAGIMFTGLLKDHEVKLSFKDFSKYGIIIALPTYAVALAMLMVML